GRDLLLAAQRLVAEQDQPVAPVDAGERRALGLAQRSGKIDIRFPAEGGSRDRAGAYEAIVLFVGRHGIPRFGPSYRETSGREKSGGVGRSAMNSSAAPRKPGTVAQMTGW